MDRKSFIRNSFLAAITMPLVDVSPEIPADDRLQELEILPGDVLIYDMQALPTDTSFDQIMYNAKNFGIIIYDSSRGGHVPQFGGPTSRHTREIDVFKK